MVSAPLGRRQFGSRGVPCRGQRVLPTVTRSRMLMRLLLLLATVLAAPLGCCSQDAHENTTSVDPSKQYTQEDIAQIFEAQTAVAKVTSRVVELALLAAHDPRDLAQLLTAVVQSSPLIYGTAMAFEPGLFEHDAVRASRDDELVPSSMHNEDGQLIYCPYAHRDPNSNSSVEPRVILKDLAAEYDYTDAEHHWYTDPKRLFLRGVTASHPTVSCRADELRVFTRQFDNSSFGPCFWSEVYFDDGGGNIDMTTYSAVFRTDKNMSYLGATYDGVPSVPDAEGLWFGGVMTVDVSLKHIGAFTCPADVCSSCPQGKAPSADETDCVQCLEGSNTFSTWGVCEPCKGTAKRDSSGLYTGCQDCAVGKRYSDMDTGCVCEKGQYDNDGMCEECDETTMTCPGGGVAVSEVAGSNESQTWQLLPRPGYWIDPSIIDGWDWSRTVDEDGMSRRFRKVPEGLTQMMKQFLNCEERICIGTPLDRDWVERSDGGYRFAGYCAGDRLHDVYPDCGGSNSTNNTDWGGYANGSTCPHPPHFCRAGHTGRLCGTCSPGTVKLANGLCCIQNSSRSQRWKLRARAILEQLLLSTILAVYMVHSAVAVSVSDSVFASATFLFQTMKLIGEEQGWLNGLPYMQEVLDAVLAAASIDSQELLWYTDEDDVCEPITCPSALAGGSTIMTLIRKVVIIPVLTLVIAYAIIHDRHLFAIASCRWKKKSAKRTEDLWPTFHRCCLAIYRFTLLPASLALIRFLVPRCYATSVPDDGWSVWPTNCPKANLFASFLSSPPDPVNADPVWLHDADPAVAFLGPVEYRVAGVAALLMLVLYLIFVPYYIYMGIYAERDSTLFHLLGDTLYRSQVKFHDSTAAQREQRKRRRNSTQSIYNISRRLSGTTSQQTSEAIIHARGIGVDGWDGSVDGRGTFEREEPLKDIFSRFGTVVSVAITHSITDDANTSWALITMATPDGAEAALAAPSVMAGNKKLMVSQYDEKIAKVAHRRDRARGRISRTRIDSGKRLSQDYENSRKKQDTAHVAARAHLLQQEHLLFSPMYGNYAEHVLSWWFFSDILKKLSVSVTYAICGNNADSSPWKFMVFLFLGMYVVVQCVCSPNLTRKGEFFEMMSCILVMVVLYSSSLHQLGGTLKAILGVLMALMVCVVLLTEVPKAIERLRGYYSHRKKKRHKTPTLDYAPVTTKADESLDNDDAVTTTTDESLDVTEVMLSTRESLDSSSKTAESSATSTAEPLAMALQEPQTLVGRARRSPTVDR
jgi:hypothetical protein